MCALHVSLDAFRAQLAPIEREVLAGLESNHLIVFDLQLNSTLLAAEAAMRLHHAVRFTRCRPTPRRHLMQVRAIALNQLGYGCWKLCHQARSLELPRPAARQSASWTRARLFRRQLGQMSW